MYFDVSGVNSKTHFLAIQNTFQKCPKINTLVAISFRSEAPKMKNVELCVKVGKVASPIIFRKHIDLCSALM